jgi:hypothetical protein
VIHETTTSRLAELATEELAAEHRDLGHGGVEARGLIAA